MEFDRDTLEALLNQKLERAERAIVRNYLTRCGISCVDATAMVDEIVSTRAQHNAAAIEAELDNARQTIAELQNCIKKQQIEFAVKDAMINAGVRSEHYDDVRKLADDAINSAVGDDGQVDTNVVNSAIADVIARIPSFSDDTQRGITGFTGRKGNFARKDDGTALMKNRLNSARAAGNNALSVSIISEAAAMGISLR